MPKISVIIPVYNVEQFLRRCIDSVLAQTFNDYEIILVDDGSTDNCPKICDEYAKSNDKIRVIHQENCGLSAARNAGLDIMCGEYVTFIDSDDWVDDNYLEILMNMIIDLSVKVSMCSFGNDKTANTLQSYVYSFEDYYSGKTGFNCIIQACCKLYDSNLWKDIRFPIGKLHEDVFTTYKVIYKAKAAAFVKANLYNIGDNDNSITRSFWNTKKLDEQEAYRSCAEFWREKGYQTFFNNNMEATMYISFMHAKQIGRYEHNKEYKTYMRIIKKEMRRCLKENRHLDVTRQVRFYVLGYTYWYEFCHFVNCNKKLPNKILHKILGEKVYEKVKQTIKK